MAHYRYQVKTATGQLQSGTISADSVMAAANTLRGQGLRVVQIVAADTRSARGKGGGLRSLNYASGPSARDVLDFTTQLAVMIRAGISIRAALEGISEQVTNVKWRTILRTIRQDVESGKQFSEAISKYPKLFSPLYVNMVRASEMSGSFAKMLDRIAAYMTQQLETRRMVIGAMIYPGVIGMMAVSVTVFLLTFVLPRFAVVFEGKEDRLPRPTIMLLALSDFMVNQWYLILGACAIVGVGFFLFLRTSFGRVWFDKMKLVAPLFKRMFRALYISRSLHTMGELLGAGVPMLDALAITGDISGNVIYKALWRTVYSDVKEGRKLAHPLQRSTLLPRAVVQMISAGEESGKLSEVLQEVAHYYNKLLRDAIKAVTSMIEPVMIIVMGAIVGFIAMAIILPIFRMSSLVK